MMTPLPVRGGEVDVACGACRACCHQLVMLADAESGFDEESIATPAGVLRVLRRQPDGSCVYLAGAGCSIHALRPACCRVFDCGGWYGRVPAAVKKAMIRAGGPNKRMVKEGRRRWTE